MDYGTASGVISAAIRHEAARARAFNSAVPIDRSPLDVTLAKDSGKELRNSTSFPILK
jgi:hypothetical protein